MKVLMFFCVVMMGRIAVVKCAAQSHSFTVRDDIEMTRFSDPRPIPGEASSELARRSPDGKYFAVVTTKGILKVDHLESRVLIFSVANARVVLNSARIRSLNPRVIATLESFPHHREGSAYASVIKDLRWSPDSTCVYYRGEGLNGNYRLYRAGIDSFAAALRKKQKGMQLQVNRSMQMRWTSPAIDSRKSYSPDKWEISIRQKHPNYILSEG
jgi:hypothetical protein